MSDVAGAPTGATPTGPQTSATPPAQGNGTNGHATQTPTPKQTGAPRASDGKFLPRESNQTHAPEGGEPSKTEPDSKPKEPYRFKKALKVFGQEKALDLDEDGLTRELQLLYSEREKRKREQGDVAKARRIIELATKDADGFYREVAQKDPTEYARERLAKEAQLAAMSEHERRAYELEQQLEQYKAKDAEREQERAAQEKAQRAEVAKQQLSATFLPALEKAGLPKTYETLYLMAETAKLALDDGIEYTADELARETAARIDGYTDRYFAKLDGPGLAKRLGPHRLQALLDHVVTSHLESQEVVPARRQPAPVSDTKDEGPIDSAEVDRRLRAIRMGK
jgi:hypothetical protein